MADLTVAKIIGIHDKVIARYGGTGGIISEDPLHRMVFSANRAGNTFRKAAVCLHAIASQRPFADGNKRTALLVAENILGQDGYMITADDDVLVEFMLAVASHRFEPDEIEQWLKGQSGR